VLERISELPPLALDPQGAIPPGMPFGYQHGGGMDLPEERPCLVETRSVRGGPDTMATVPFVA